MYIYYTRATIVELHNRIIVLIQVNLVTHYKHIQCCAVLIVCLLGNECYNQLKE